MSWGDANNVVTTNLDAGTDSPAAARADIKTAFDELTNVINGRNTANGVAGLNANSKLTQSQLPNTIISDTGLDLTLDPSSERVNIDKILNLPAQTVAELNARTSINEGDVAFCSDGDAGTACLAIATGEDDSAGNPVWKVIAIGAEIST